MFKILTAFRQELRQLDIGLMILSKLNNQMGYWYPEKGVTRFQKFNAEKTKYSTIFMHPSKAIPVSEDEIRTSLAECKASRINLYEGLLQSLSDIKKSIKDTKLRQYVETLAVTLNESITCLNSSYQDNNIAINKWKENHEDLLKQVKKRLNILLLFINGYQQGLYAFTSDELSINTLASLGAEKAKSEISQVLKYLYTINFEVMQQTTATSSSRIWTRKTTSPLSIAVWLIDTSVKTLANYWYSFTEKETTVPLFYRTLLASQWYEDFKNNPLFNVLQFKSDDPRIEMLLCDLIGYLSYGNRYTDEKHKIDFNVLLSQATAKEKAQLTDTVINLLTYAKGFHCGVSASLSITKALTTHLSARIGAEFQAAKRLQHEIHADENPNLENLSASVSTTKALTTHLSAPIGAEFQAAKRLQHETHAHEHPNLEELIAGTVEPVPIARWLSYKAYTDLRFVFSALNSMDAIEALQRKSQLSEDQFRQYCNQTDELSEVFKKVGCNIKEVLKLQKRILFLEGYNAALLYLTHSLKENQKQSITWELAFDIHCFLVEGKYQLLANVLATSKDYQIIHELWLKLRGGITAQKLLEEMQEKQKHLNKSMQEQEAVLYKRIQGFQRAFNYLLFVITKQPNYQAGLLCAEFAVLQNNALLTKNPSANLLFVPFSSAQKKTFKRVVGGIHLAFPFLLTFGLKYSSSAVSLSYWTPTLIYLSPIPTFITDHLMTTTRMPTFLNAEKTRRVSQYLLSALVLYITMLLREDENLMPAFIAVSCASLCSSMLSSLVTEEMIAHYMGVSRLFANLLRGFQHALGHFALSTLATSCTKSIFKRWRNSIEEKDKISQALKTFGFYGQDGLTCAELKAKRNVMLLEGGHPDKVGPTEKGEASMQFHEINAAYKTLGAYCI